MDPVGQLTVVVEGSGFRVWEVGNQRLGRPDVNRSSGKSSSVHAQLFQARQVQLTLHYLHFVSLRVQVPNTHNILAQDLYENYYYTNPILSA